MIKVGLVEDQQIVRQGIILMLKTAPQVELILSAATPYEFLENVKDQVPEVLLLDIALPQMSGIELARTVLKEHKKIKILFLSSNTAREYVKKAMKAGGKGFLSKNCSKEELIKGIEAVCSGNLYFDASISQNVYQDFLNFSVDESSEATLTDRELDVMKGLANGLSYKEIADQYNISVKTVETHRSAIFKKLEFGNNSDLIKYAIKNHIIEL